MAKTTSGLDDPSHLNNPSFIVVDVLSLFLPASLNGSEISSAEGLVVHKQEGQFGGDSIRVFRFTILAIEGLDQLSDGPTGRLETKGECKASFTECLLILLHHEGGWREASSDDRDGGDKGSCTIGQTTQDLLGIQATRQTRMLWCQSISAQG